MKAEKADTCEACAGPLRKPCPQCGRRVEVIKGKLKSHDTSTVHGSHMTWGSCGGSNKPAV